MDIVEFYSQAKQYVIQNGFQWELDIVEKRKFADQYPDDFLREYVYVVCNSGMKNQIAEKIFQRWWKFGYKSIGHPGKREAVKQAEKNKNKIFNDLPCNCITVKIPISETLEYLESLPWIGKITKYHLARNIGLDVAKPDRHLVRIADHLGYSDIQQMCKKVSEYFGDRIGTVDVVLWRYCNLNPDYLSELNHCSKIGCQK